jgi:hypothetical protein
MYRRICEFKRKDNNGDLLADSHKFLNRWEKFFLQLLMSIISMMLSRHTAVPLVSGPSCLEVEVAIEKLKKNTNHHVVIKFWQN